MPQTLYEILEVISTASPETIRAAYLSLVKKYHPDKSGTEDQELLRICQEINVAYEVLRDPGKRSEYDSSLGYQQQPEPEPAASAEVAVSPSPNRHGSINAAIANAKPGTRILVRPGVYREFLVLNKDIEIAGDGPAEQIIVEGTDGVSIQADTTLAIIRGVTLRSTVSVAGGRLVVENCAIRTESGSGVYVAGQASVDMRRCRVHDCGQYGIYFNGLAGGIVEDCDLSGNGTLENPGQICVRDGAYPIVRSCRIRDGRVYGIMVRDANGTFENCDISGNAIAGVAVIGSGNPQFTDCSIHDTRETGDFGGNGLWSMDGGRGTFERCDIFSNSNSGIRVTSEGRPTIVDCNIRNQQIGIVIRDGGDGMIMTSEIADCTSACVVVSDKGKATVKKCRMSRAPVGAASIDDGAGNFEDCEIANMTDRGVYITTGGHPIFRRCDIYGNKAFGVGADNGGGLLEGCDIFNNQGTGVGLDAGATTVIHECNIRQNKGLGVFASNGAGGRVENCNLTGNGDGPILVHKANTAQVGNRTDGVTVRYTGR